MPRWKLRYSGRCLVSLIVDIDGTEIPLREVLIDTGFYGDAGVQLPLTHMRHARQTQTTTVELADGTPHSRQCVFARIVAIGDERLKQPVDTWFVFSDGDTLLGTAVLQSFKLNLDGPKQEATMKL